MEPNKYYLPLESKNLAHYLVKACLCPVNYITNRNEDIQNLFPNYILLSNEKFVQDTNCSLEIILNRDEEEVIKISDNFFLFEKPLPITRIKKVFFRNHIQRVQTGFDINSGAAFLPEKLTEIDETTESINTYQLKNTTKTLSNDNWNDKLDLFNRILGGFSLMSVSGNENSYPTDYFHALSIFNKLIKDELVNQSVPLNNNYEWALIKGDKFVELYQAIHSKIDSNIINHFALKENITLTRNNGKIAIDKIQKKSNTYNIATLGSYGDGTRLSIDNFISDLVSDKFPPEKKEGLSIMFGINQGYDIFRNRYKTKNFEIDVKFQLNSQLDYLTIESVYQYVFNGKTNNYTFNYLSWCPQYKDSKDFAGYDTFDILDRTFAIKKKETSSLLFQNLFQSISKETIYDKLIAEHIKYLPPFAKMDSKESAINYFDNILEDSLRDYANAFFLKGSQENLENEKKNKELIQELENLVENQKNRIKELESQLLQSNKNTNNKIIPKSVTKVIKSENFGSPEPTLIPIENDEEYLFNKRKKELKSLGITKLKAKAKDLGVKNTNEYNKENIEKLVEVILEIEFKTN